MDVDDFVLDPIMLGYAFAALGMIIYAFFLWLKMRAIYIPSPRMAKFINLCCFALLLAPFAARYQYSKAAILYLSAGMCMIAFLIKLKQKMGL